MVNVCSPPALILWSCVALSACGDISGALDFVDSRDAFEARRNALQDRSNTAYRAVPDTGASTYTGEATLAVGTRSNGVVVIGDASVTINFETNTVTGELANFSGFDTNEDFSDYAGILVFEDGLLGAVNPNDTDAQIVGVLTGDSNIISVDALWEGHLKGTPIVGVLGDTTPSSSTFILNGVQVVGGIVIAVTD